ncbi:hypothetical protein GCM10011396_25520 [Undibacterium terreum]|uniref:Uncharacterized protein n=2 Tax=Undibacterium terreum TaxID=1224302 RepID=A0A916XJ86_9BURK|nr:hypothetical protein GCM10011396_25520 [Undibacterium terreum]
MKEVFVAAQIVVQDYDWYISDIETNFTPEGFSQEDQWMRGEDLAFLIQEYDLQFIWAVFSAVPKGLRLSVSNVPYVDGNPDYWNGKDPGPQLDGALFEIACWDSSATILINLPEQAERSFISNYSDTRLLSEANATRQAESLL